MAQTLYDNEMLRRYLLGTAHAEEEARLDALSLTDDECALALVLVENDLVDAYASATLSAADRAQFEQHYLASPLRREKAHFALELQRLGKPVAAPFVSRKTDAPPLAARFARFRLPPLWQVGLAAAAGLLLIVCGWLLAENRRLRQQAEAERATLREREQELNARQTAATSNQDELSRVRERLAQLEARLAASPSPHSLLTVPATQLFTFTLAAPLRGTTSLPKLALLPQTATVAVRLELEANAYPRYRVALRDALTNRILWRSGKLAATRDKNGLSLTARVPGKLLATQRYTFELSGVTAENAEERLSSYPFEIRQP